MRDASEVDEVAWSSEVKVRACAKERENLVLALVSREREDAGAQLPNLETGKLDALGPLLQKLNASSKLISLALSLSFLPFTHRNSLFSSCPPLSS